MWNWVIRLLFENVLELSFAVALNLKYSNPNKYAWAALLDYTLSCGIGVLIILLPIFILVFYYYHFDKLEGDKEFEDKYGTIMEGMNPMKKSAVAYNAIFVVRRILFVCASLFLFEYNMV